MSIETLIAGLSHDEKLAAMELLWRDLAAKSDALPSPPWHGDVISHRLNHPSPEPALPLEQAVAEVKEAFHASRTSKRSPQ